MWRSQGRSTLAGQILWAGKAEQEEVASPLDDIWGKFQNSVSELCFFKGGTECLVLFLHPMQFLAAGGT